AGDDPSQLARVKGFERVEFNRAFAILLLELLAALLRVLNLNSREPIFVALLLRQRYRAQFNIKTQSHLMDHEFNLSCDGKRHRPSAGIEIRKVENADRDAACLGALDELETSGKGKFADARHEVGAMRLRYRVKNVTHGAFLNPYLDVKARKRNWFLYDLE